MDRIETQRLILRRWRIDDFEPFHRINSDPLVMEFFPSVLTPDQTRAFLARIESGFQEQGFGLWAAELKSSKEMIGFIGLSVPAFKAIFTPCVEIGWRLAPEHWGKGLATEGAKKVLEFGFREKKLPEILSWTSKINLPSRRVMEKIGMSYDPRDDFEHPLRPMDIRLRPHVLYRMKREEFEKLRLGP